MTATYAACRGHFHRAPSAAPVSTTMGGGVGADMSGASSDEHGGPVGVPGVARRGGNGHDEQPAAEFLEGPALLGVAGLAGDGGDGVGEAELRRVAAFR